MLKLIDGHTGFLELKTKVGVVINRKEAVIIDSGVDENVGRKVLKALGGEFSIKAIFFTHSHADHYGGASFIRKRVGALTYAPRIEACIIENPIIEALEFSYAAVPLKTLLNKFICGEACEVDRSFSGGDEIEAVGLKFKVVDLPGHSVNHCGIVVGNTFYLGDSVFPYEVLEKYKIAYLHDPKKAIESLVKIKDVEVDNFLLYHGDLLSRSEIKSLISYNISSINTILDVVYENACGSSFNQVVKTSLNSIGLKPKDLTEYYLLSSTLRGYLSCLVNEGKVSVALEDGEEKFYR